MTKPRRFEIGDWVKNKLSGSTHKVTRVSVNQETEQWICLDGYESWTCASTYELMEG